MCIQSDIQNKIAELTNNGEHIAYFLVDTMAGASDHATKTCHRLDAAKLLTKYGIPQHNHNTTEKHHDTDTTEKHHDNTDTTTDNNTDQNNNQTPTLHDIIAYPTARYIREHTQNGETLIQTLCHIMRGGTPKLDFFTGEYTNTVKPHHRIAAAKELLQRAFGETTTRRSPHIHHNLDNLDQNDPAGTHIAKLTRDHTANGIEAAALLISIIDDDENHDWQPAHQLAAAKELLHRAYDLNYDAVTLEHIITYNSIAYPEPIHEAAHKLERKRRIQELIDAYDEARKSGNQQAANDAERAYHHYLKHGDQPEDTDNPANTNTNQHSNHQLAVNQLAVNQSYPTATRHTPNNRSP